MPKRRPRWYRALQGDHSTQNGDVAGLSHAPRDVKRTVERIYKESGEARLRFCIKVVSVHQKQTEATTYLARPRSESSRQARRRRARTPTRDRRGRKSACEQTQCVRNTTSPARVGPTGKGAPARHNPSSLQNSEMQAIGSCQVLVTVSHKQVVNRTS
jgi:hypothetical protein